MRQLVLILTGLSGSGKTTASAFFCKINIPVVRMGEITERLLQKKRLSPSEKNESFIRTNLRKRQGDDIYARLTVREILNKIKKSPIVVIEGMRSKIELRCFQRELPYVKVVFIDADKQTRGLRLIKRRVRPLTFEEIQKREAWEETLGVVLLKKIADVVIKNQGTKKSLYAKLGKALTNI